MFISVRTAPRRRAVLRLGLSLGLCVPLSVGVLGAGGCGKSDSSKDAAASKGEEKPTEAGGEDGGEGIDGLDLDNRQFPLLVWATYMASQDYYDPSRFDPRGQLASAADTLGLHTPEFFGEVQGDSLEVRVGAATKSFDLAGLETISDAGDLLEEVLVFVQAQLSLEDEPLHELEYAAINGFFAPLDANSILLTPEEHADLGVKTRGHFGGIGAEIRAADRRILVARVLPDSPAQAAGLLDGDLIVKIDEQSTVNMSSADAQQLLRGPVDTKVVLKVVREGKTVTVTITRDEIEIPSVDSALLPGGVGYVSIASFQADTSEKVEAALASLSEASGGGDGLEALVLDLRGNSGGLLLQATEVVDQFVTGGELVIVHSAQGRESTEATKQMTIDQSVPVVVLVNEASASAAEVVSGGLKHLGRGVVIGQDSFGKGTVQQLSAARPYGRELALKLTIAEYRVAGDRKINAVGVHTDVSLVPVQFSEIDGVARYYDEERFERSRLRSRLANHPSAKHDANPNAFVSNKRLELRYLDLPPEPPKVSENSGKPDRAADFMADPEIRIARELAHELVGTKGRDAQLEKLAEPVARLMAEQDEAIVNEARSHGVEWTERAEAAAGDAPLAVELTIQKPESLTAGESFRLQVAVTNEGSAPVERVHLITECAQDEIDGIELLLGTIAPGERRVETLELYFMPWHASLEDRLRVDAHVGEPNGKPDGSAEAMFALSGPQRPQLAFDYWIVDDPALAKAAPRRPEPRFPEEVPFEIVGNGDGVLSPGEKVLFAFEARNDGPGLAEDARAILSNLSGAQGLLEEGLVVLGELEPGKTRVGAFGIDVSKEADPALPFELDFLLGDGQIRESVGDKIRLRVGKKTAARRFEPGRAALTVGLDGARLYAGAHGTSRMVTQVAPGATLQALGRAGDWYAVLPPGARGKDAPAGRRLWVPADVVELEGGGESPESPDHLMIDPPRIELGEVPGHVRAERVTVTGTVSHPAQVRDVMIVVYPSDPARPPRKVHYAANPAFDPSGTAKAGDTPSVQPGRFEFSATVPLAPGSNRISIVARDADKVERRHDHWVYFEP